MTTPPPPDVLGAFFGRQGRRVAPASRVTRRTREREITGYQSAFPDTSREQARRATARMRQRGQVPTYTTQPTTEQAAQAQRFRQRSEQSREAARQRQRLGGGGIGLIRYVDDEQVYQALLNAFEYTNAVRASRGQSGAPFIEWNEQIARWNIAHASVADKERWLNADPWDLLQEASNASKSNQFSFLFYHNDYYQAV